MASTTIPKIGIIICSTRSPRACPQIAAFVLSAITPLLNSSTSSMPLATTSIIDLSEQNLPMYNEPTIPSRNTHHSQYVQPHTQAWSQLVQSYDGFVFVCPQYNWGYPAALKNAVDYLFNEWKSKPSMIVTYGGHGGGKCAAQLRQVLEGGIGMQIVETMPSFTFPDRTIGMRAAKGEDMMLPDGAWADGEMEVVKAWGEMMGLLGKRGEVAV